PYDLTTDMTWTCPATATSSRAPAPPALPQGYTFSLKDIGCPARQKVTIRPVVDGAVKYVQVEQYGSTLNTVKVEVKYNENWYFDYHQYGFDIEGYLSGDYNPTDGADVTFTKIKWYGEDQCDLGTYTFSKEQ